MQYWGDSPGQAIIDSISAAATAAAAWFAWRSARASARAADEMLQARQQANSPLLVVDRAMDAFSISADTDNQMFHVIGELQQRPAPIAFKVENHGAAPALNVHVSYEASSTEVPLAAPVRLATNKITDRADSYVEASADGFRWTGSPKTEKTEQVGFEFFPSIPSGESVSVTIDRAIFMHHLLDYVSEFQHSDLRARIHATNLLVEVTYDTPIEARKDETFVVQLRTASAPEIGVVDQGFGSQGFRLGGTVEVVPMPKGTPLWLKRIIGRGTKA